MPAWARQSCAPGDTGHTTTALQRHVQVVLAVIGRRARRRRPIPLARGTPPAGAWRPQRGRRRADPVGL